MQSFSKSNYKYNGRDFDDELIQEKLKQMNKEVITETKIVTEKTESYYKVLEKKTGENLILYKTSTPSIFIALFKGKNGVVQRKDTTWVFEYLEDHKITTETIDININ